MTRPAIFVCLATVLSTPPAFGQHAEGVLVGPNQLQRAPVLMTAAIEPFGVLAIEPFDVGAPVAGAPYSAEIVTEMTQTLADGTRIERRITSSVARDGRGRIRRDQQIAAIGNVVPQGEVRFVTIIDPVARVHISLDPQRRVATRSRMLQASKAVPGTFIAVAEPAPAAPEVRTESLGTMQIEGVRADGTRTVLIIPAGAIGNDRPIEVVSDRWFSPELQVVLLSTRSDPRFGQTTYRLTNVVRAEPAPELFVVPPDYTVQQAGK